MDAALPNTRVRKDLTDLPLAVLVMTDLFEVIGPDHVAGFVVHSGNIRIQPSELRDGEEIAAMLGLPFTLDQQTTAPETTDFYGSVRGVEVHVRGALRRRAA